MKRPDKNFDINDVNRRGREGRFSWTKHATDQADVRNVTLAEAKHVLGICWWQKSKDEFDTVRGCWKYAVRGDTPDGKRLRLILAINPSDMLLITVIDIDLDEKNE